jgi:hypothetical protein
MRRLLEFAVPVCDKFFQAALGTPARVKSLSLLIRVYPRSSAANLSTLPIEPLER